MCFHITEVRFVTISGVFFFFFCRAITNKLANSKSLISLSFSLFPSHAPSMRAIRAYFIMLKHRGWELINEDHTWYVLSHDFHIMRVWQPNGRSAYCSCQPFDSSFSSSSTVIRDPLSPPSVLLLLSFSRFICSLDWLILFLSLWENVYCMFWGVFSDMHFCKHNWFLSGSLTS